MERSLNEDTLPLFRGSDYEIKDWAAGNMNWSDVKHAANQVKAAQLDQDFVGSWINGEKEVVGEPAAQETPDHG